MRNDDHDVTPSPTDEEAAAIAAAIAIVRQQAELAATTTPPPSRWREAGKREILRDRTTPSVEDD